MSRKPKINAIGHYRWKKSKKYSRGIFKFKQCGRRYREFVRLKPNPNKIQMPLIRRIYMDNKTLDRWSASKKKKLRILCLNPVKKS